MVLSDFRLVSLDETTRVDSFDCLDEDLNDFLQNDSLNYQKEKITNTYLFLDKDEVVAFFALSSDCLNDLGYENSIWNKLHRNIKLPNSKRIRQYPAIKITRLGIDKKGSVTKVGD